MVVTAPDIPGYRVGDVLGTGAFATVYRYWQLAVGWEVAVKVDNRALLSERDRRRFFREVTAAGRLSSHPHVIVYDAGTLADGRPYLVMELCPADSPRFPAGSRPPSLVTIMTLHDKPVEDIPGTPPALMAGRQPGVTGGSWCRPSSG